MNIKNIEGYDVFDTRFEDPGFQLRVLDPIGKTGDTSQNEKLQQIINDMKAGKVFVFSIGGEAYYTNGERKTEGTDYYYSFMSYSGTGFNEVKVYVNSGDVVQKAVRNVHEFVKYVSTEPTTLPVGMLAVK